MRIPKIIKRNPEDSLNTNILKINVTPLEPLQYEPDIDFDDEKSVLRYVRSTKSIIRQSREYKELVKFLKNKCDINECFFLPKVKKYRDSKVSIELHHTGFVIEDIIKIVLKKRYANNENYSQTAVANEVMDCHYRGMIALTALSSTGHELIHDENSTLFIPIQMCDFGDMNKFYDEYLPYISKDLRERYEQYRALSIAVENIEDIIPDYMDVKIIYYIKQGVEYPDMNKILEVLKGV